MLCSADISFSWVRHVHSPVAAPEDGAATDPKATPPKRAEVVGTPVPSVVRFAGVQRLGFDEAGAKASLQVEVNRQKARAYETCKKEHESLGDCLATKLSTKASTLNSLGFSSRSELEKALAKECSDQQGSCLAVESSEPQCRPISAGKGGEAAAGGKKNDAKKAESKKK